MTVRLRVLSRPSRKQTLWGLLGLAAAGVVAYVGSRRFLGRTDAAPSDDVEDEQAGPAEDTPGGGGQA